MFDHLSHYLSRITLPVVAASIILPHALVGAPADESSLFGYSESGLLSIVGEDYFQTLKPYSSSEAYGALPFVSSGTLRGAGFSDEATDGAYLESIELDSIHVDHYEIFRGPDRIGNGYWGLGQVVNAVTKRPDESGDFVRTQVMSGTGGKIRGTVDYNTNLLPNASAAFFGFRLTGSYVNSEIDRYSFTGGEGAPSRADFEDKDREGYDSWVVGESASYKLEEGTHSDNEYSFAPSLLYQTERTSLLVKHMRSDNISGRLASGYGSDFLLGENEATADVSLVEWEQLLGEDVKVRISHTWADNEGGYWGGYRGSISVSQDRAYDTKRIISYDNDARLNTLRASVEYEFEFLDITHLLSLGHTSNLRDVESLHSYIQVTPRAYILENDPSHVFIGSNDEASLTQGGDRNRTELSSSFVAYDSSFFDGKLDLRTSIKFDEIDYSYDSARFSASNEGLGVVETSDSLYSDTSEFDDWNGEFALSYHFSDNISGYALFSQAQNLDPVRDHSMIAARHTGSGTLGQTDYYEAGVALDAGDFGQGSLGIYRNSGDRTAYDSWDGSVLNERYGDFEGIELAWQINLFDQLDILWTSTYSVEATETEYSEEYLRMYEGMMESVSAALGTGVGAATPPRYSDERVLNSTLWLNYVFDEGFLKGAEIGGLATFEQLSSSWNPREGSLNTLDLFVSVPVGIPGTLEGRIFANGYDVGKGGSNRRSWVAGIEVGF